MREPVQAVHDVDVGELVESLGMTADLDGGRIFCSFCEERITPQSIGAVYPAGERIDIVCDRPQCMARLLTVLNRESVERPPRQGED